MRVLIYGAGVVGQIYGGRLTQAGHEVTLLARGRTLEALTVRGVSLAAIDASCQVRLRVVGQIPADEAFDVVLVTVRRDQVDEVLPAIAVLNAARVVFLLNQSADLASVARQVGTDRTLFAFPGVGGHRADDGTIRYFQVPQQKTTIERRTGLHELVVELMRSAHFPVDVTGDMEGWLQTHTVFITVMGAAILECGGDSVVLAADRARVAAMVTAVGEGFRALAREGVAVRPAPLRFLFTVAPRSVAVRYWQRQLRGPVGTVSIAPHMRVSRTTEFPALCADVRALVAGDGATPHLDRLLDAVAPRGVEH